MTNQQKNIAFWLGIAIGAVFVVFLLVTIKQKSDTAPTTNTVSFNGEGKVSAKPDIAMADFSIITTAVTSKAAQDANSAKSKKVSDFLAKQGVDDKDIKSTYYNVTPQYYYPTQKPYPMVVPMEGSVDSRVMVAPSTPESLNPKITGYQVTQSYQVKLRDFDKVSVILDGLVTAGANQVSNVQFTIENQDKLLADARGKAIADAKKKASDLQKQIGINLGKIVNFYESGSPVYYSKLTNADSGYGMGGGAPSGPVLNPGENDITVQVTITYQIK